MDVVIQTRFSYLGQSGWRSNASRSEVLLFEPQRLDKRFALFERIMLPSLCNQTDADFRLIVLSSKLLPPTYQKKLIELTADLLGSRRVSVKFARPGYASKKMAAEISKDFDSADPIAEAVLDDDDALATSYVRDLRLAAGGREMPQREGHQHLFVTFPNGLTMFKQNGATVLESRNVAFTNLGLALIAKPGSGRNIFAVSHKRIGERHPHLVIETEYPVYVRTVHGTNDSRAMFGNNAIDTSMSARLIADHFPHLAGLDPAILD